MRAAELLGRPVHDRDGAEVGRVLDIRITRVTGTSDPGVWHIDGVVIGHRWAFARVGYAYGDLGGPLPLATAMSRLGRHLRFARWDQVDTAAGNPVIVNAAMAELPHPKEV